MKVGTDITSIQRIKRLIDRFGNRFMDRFLTPHEQKNLKKIESIAGYWAAKEAISKALGCGIGGDLAFHDMIITKTPQGAPEFTLTPDAQKRHPYTQSSLSISHDGGFAIAVVVIN
jgi:holo-[acyl-carrier protein] synthase